MKRFIVVILAVIMILSLSGCSEFMDSVWQENYYALQEAYDELQGKYDAVVSERDELLNSSPTTELTGSADIPQTTSAPETTVIPETTEVVEKSNLLYEDEKIKVTYRKVEKIYYVEDSIEIHFYIQNKTDGTLLIQADVFSLNGYSFSNPTMSDNILAHTTGKAIALIVDFDFDIVDIKNIFSVGGQFRVYEEDFQNVYTAIFNDIQVN